MTDRYDENLILGHVEGELTAAERSAFERQLADDAELRHLVADMAADRAALRSLRGERAPTGLVDAAIGHLERRMLLDTDAQAEDSTVLAGPIPIRAAAQRRPTAKRWLAGLSIAAVLAVSGAVMWQTLVVPEESVTQLAMEDTTSRISPATPEPAALDRAARETHRDEPAETVAPVESTAKADAEPAPPPEPEPAPIDPIATLAEGGSAMDEYAERSLTHPRSRQQAVSPAAPPTAVAAPATGFDDAMAKARGAVGPSPTMMQTQPDPQWRVRVATRSNTDAEQQVMRWALSNDAQVIEPPTARPPTEDTRAMRSMALNEEAKDADAATQTVIVELAEPQIDALVAYLNTRNADQRAVVVDDPAPTGQLAQSPPADAPVTTFGQTQAPALPRPYDVDWSALLEAQLPLTPVQRIAPLDPDLTNVLPPRRVRVLVEIDEVVATEDAPP